MIFWDTSALLPAFFLEPTSQVMQELYTQMSPKTIWTLTPVEFITALARLEREQKLTPQAKQEIRSHFEFVLPTFDLITDIETVKNRACKIVNIHPLKSSDALQLAAALAACLDNPLGHSFITLDKNLATAALKEGFKVLPEKRSMKDSFTIKGDIVSPLGTDDWEVFKEKS